MSGWHDRNPLDGGASAVALTREQLVSDHELQLLTTGMMRADSDLPDDLELRLPAVVLASLVVWFAIRAVGRVSWAACSALAAASWRRASAPFGQRVGA
jgi:hypothetical protein